MVVRIAELEAKEPGVRFVPRKKRRADLENVAVARADLANVAADVDADVDESGSTYAAQHKSADHGSAASAAPVEAPSAPLAVPSWRLHREAEQARDAEQPDTSSGPTRWTEKKRSEMTDRDWRIMRTDLQIRSSAPIEPLLRWSELGAPQLVRLLSKTFPTPMPVQRASIGLACLGSAPDIVAIAPTGSGKTLGFVVPVAERRIPESLVLAPTRELALQIAEVGQLLGLQVVSLVGGHDFEDQAKQLNSLGRGQRLLVATPGRLLDFLAQKLVDLQNCTYLVFDEADRMIDLGFEPQIAEIMASLPASRQTMMFSATWPPTVRELSAKFLRPGFVKVDISGIDRESSRISQSVELVSQDQKPGKLLALVRQAKPTIICFVATKASAESVSAQIKAAGISCEYLHGGLSQDVRDATLEALRNRRIKCLVATDVASRGVDVHGISLVINYDLPQSAEVYVHRIGRTGRAGERGRAVSYATDADAALFPELRRLLRESGSPLPAFLNRG